MARHVGIIMDGNGRWAQRRGQNRTQGHLEGLQTAKGIVKTASSIGIDYLTLYAFSTENWKRADDEVSFIMALVKQYLKSELNFYRDNRIRLRYAGDKEGLPPDIQKEIEDTCEYTRDFQGLQVILALNYGGRDEIVRAVKRMLRDRGGGEISASILGQYLDNPDVPDPDLIIRTAGEFRTSNFLLWEGAYAEYYISDKFWPDWRGEDLIRAVEDFKNRERRFGALKAAFPAGGTL
jgi:undecaprenyl diphosphate synthase